MESFIGLDVERLKSEISLYLDSYIRETLDIYSTHPAAKTLRLKSTAAKTLRLKSQTKGTYPGMQPGYVLTSEVVPENWQKYQKRSDKHSIVRW